VLAVIRKRRSLNGRREGCGGLPELQTEVVEVAFWRRMGAEFIDEGPEIGQRADRGEAGRISRPDQAA
jgi:hypothetical protein